ncbi:MAG TPA: lysylphosphatidylglycerol synthase transmembrane domain-containing protein [Chloroflexota bacterium]
MASWRKGLAGAKHMLRAHVSVIFALVVALGLLAYVSYLASVRSAGGQLWIIVQHTWLLVLVLTFPYLGARALVWYELLEQLQIRVPWRQLMVAFAAGEITKSLPAGIYVQNLLLSRLRHLGQVSAVRSATATTAMLGLESALAVPIVIIIGVPGAPWLRETLLGIVAAWVVVLLLASALVRYRARHIGPETALWRRRAVQAIEEFLTAGRELISFRTAKNLVPTAIYMLIYSIDLYAITRAAGIHNFSVIDAVDVYALTVLAVILIPIPTELGITEFAGLGGLLAFGIPRPTAALIILSLRLLATGATDLVSAAVLLLLRQELVTRKTEMIAEARAGQ